MNPVFHRGTCDQACGALLDLLAWEQLQSLPAEPLEPPPEEPPSEEVDEMRRTVRAVAVEKWMGEELGWSNPEETRGSGRRRATLDHLVFVHRPLGRPASGWFTRANLRVCEHLVAHLQRMRIRSVKAYGRHIDEAQADLKRELGITKPALIAFPKLRKAVLNILPGVQRLPTIRPEQMGFAEFPRPNRQPRVNRSPRGVHSLAVHALAGLGDVQNVRSVYKGLRASA
jgi:hypothetical protein